MSADLILFLILALVALTTALGMLLSRHAVYSALFLVLNLATVAVFYVLLSAPFIAMIQVTVYTGAIMVLFLFVIMLLGAEALPPTRAIPWQKWLSGALALILVVESIYILTVRARPSGAVIPPPVSVNAMDELRAMASMLFNQYLFPFEVTSILLLVAMVGTIVLTIKMKGEQN